MKSNAVMGDFVLGPQVVLCGKVHFLSLVVCSFGKPAIYFSNFSFMGKPVTSTHPTFINLL